MDNKKNTRCVSRNKLFFCGLAIIATVIFGSIFPQKASALVGDDTGAMVMPFVQPITNFLVQTAMKLVTQGVYLSVSGQLLQAAVSNPQWINVQVGTGITQSPFVTTGLTFTITIANILLIIAFIVIAMGFIFKIERVDPAKALPKFLISALLVNFGPLFVGMMVDISNIFNASVIVGKPDIFAATCNNFMAEMFRSALMLLVPIIFNGLAALVTGANILKVATFLVTVPVLTFGQIPTYLLQIMLGEILTGLVFSNAIFFVSRIFVMQILTVLAPMAILARALPQTEHWFRTWLTWLIGWSLGGILVLFLLTLGFSSSQMLMPTNMQPLEPATYGSYQLVLTQRNLYWLFLAIYMMVVDIVAGMVIPQAASQIEQRVTKSLGGAKTAGKAVGSKLEDRLSPENPAIGAAPGGNNGGGRGGQTTLNQF